MLEMTVAIQSALKTDSRRGLQADATFWEAPSGSSFSAALFLADFVSS